MLEIAFEGPIGVEQVEDAIRADHKAAHHAVVVVLDICQVRVLDAVLQLAGSEAVDEAIATASPRGRSEAATAMWQDKSAAGA